MERDRRRLIPRAYMFLISTVLLLSSLAAPALGGAATSRTFVPIGGGYSSETLQGFARTVIEHADGGTINILVVPSSYGDDPADREENIELAQSRTAQVEDECDAVINEYVGVVDCEAALLLLFDRADAMNAENSVALSSEETDGVFILGGDQEIAMRVLAVTPAEKNMQTAYENGVVFGGTSAGAAVQSQTMFWYTRAGWPYNALEKPMIEVWWFDGEKDRERGLVFGSENMIIDQHYYQRGRMTRLLNVVAQSDERFGGQSKLGLGVDYETGVSLTDDSILSGVFGHTSVAIVDAESAGKVVRGKPTGATIDWIGTRQTLSARNLLTHVMAQHPTTMVTYDVKRRMPVVNGSDLRLTSVPGWDQSLLASPGRDLTLILGGDVSLDFTGPVVAEFTNRAGIVGTRLVVVAAGYKNSGQASSAAETYVKGLRDAGWSRPNMTIDTIVVAPGTSSKLDPRQLDGAAGVIFVGGDQADLSTQIRAVEPLMRHALENNRVVMTDRAMTAITGAWFVTNNDPTDSNYQDASIEAFRDGEITISRGLDIFSGASFEPRLTYDQRWGRLYSMSRAHPQTIAFGISEMTALVVDASGARVAGTRSVVALDGRAAIFRDGDNGAFSAFNVLMDIFAPGESVASAR